MISLMLVILAAVLVAIEKARCIQVKNGGADLQTVWSGLAGVFVSMFALVFVAALIGWALLYARRRSGVHRLASLNLSSGQSRSGTLV